MGGGALELEGALPSVPLSPACMRIEKGSINLSATSDVEANSGRAQRHSRATKAYHLEQRRLSMVEEAQKPRARYLGQSQCHLLTERCRCLRLGMEMLEGSKARSGYL